MSTTKNVEHVVLELATEIGDHSVAKIESKNSDSNTDAYISNTVRMNVSADPESGVWISISGHTFARVGYEEPFTTSVDFMSHHFTKAEAQALLALLVRELSLLD
jgi:hypothetical protein